MGLFGGLFGKKAAKKNQAAALELAKKAEWQPTNMNLGGNTVSWNGTNVSAQIDPTQQALAYNMLGAGSDWLGQVGGPLPGIGQSGMNFNSVQNPNISPVNMQTGLNPFLASQFGQTNRMMQGMQGVGYDGGFLGSLAQQAANPYSSGMGGQFNETASGFLGSLGSFDPAQLAGQYTDLLRQGAQPTEQRAANSALNSLFATGRLGTTGGSQMYEGLANAQQQADIQRQIAGLQFGGQEQNRIAGLAGNFGQMGEQMNQSAFGMNQQGMLNAGNLFNTNFGNQMNAQGFNNNVVNQRAQSRFANAMQLFGGSQDLNAQQANVGLQNNAQALQQSGMTAQQMQQDQAMGLQQQGMNMDAQQAMMQAQLAQQGLFGQIGMGLTGQGLDYNSFLQSNLLNNVIGSGNLSGMRSQTQMNAWQPYYQATVARNNANSSFWGGLLDTGLKSFGFGFGG